MNMTGSAGDVLSPWGAAQPVDCEFCGATVPPGAKLCTACRSALKRARNEPVSVLQPLVRRASETLQRRGSRKSKARTDGRAAALIPPPVNARRGFTPALAGALAAAVCIIGYAILQHGEEGARADSPIDAVPAASAPALPAAAAPSLAQLAPIVLPPAAELEAPPHAAIKSGSSRRRKAPAPVVLTPMPIAVAMPMAQPLPAPVVAVKAAPPDRRTRLRTAFARCASDNILAQAYCEQRARLELCEGLWGSVPQCPAQRDYGN